MNGSGVSILIIACLALLIPLFFSLRFSKQIKTNEDFHTGGRDLPVYVVAGSQFATMIGGGVMVGHIGNAYKWGWGMIAYAAAMIFVYIFFIAMAKWLRESEFVTVMDAIQSIYGDSKTILLIGVGAAVFSMMCSFAEQLVAFSKLFVGITGLPSWVLMLTFGIINCLFLLPAGLKSVAWTDFVFGCIMLVMCVLSLFFVFRLPGAGLANAKLALDPKFSEFPKGIWGVGSFQIMAWLFAIFPGTVSRQPYLARIFAAKDVKTAKRGFFIAAILCFAVEVWVCLMGLNIHAANPNLTDPELASGWFLANTPFWFTVLYGAFLAVATVSTADSLLEGLVSQISRDVYKRVINPEIDEVRLKTISRWIAVLLTALGLTNAIVFPEAMGWNMYGFSVGAVVLAVPLLGGFFLKDKKFCTPTGCIAAMIAGMVGALVRLNLIKSSPLPYAVWGLIFSLITYIVVCYATKDKYFAGKAA